VTPLKELFDPKGDNHMPSIRVTNVGSKFGVEVDLFIVKTFDTYTEALAYVSNVREKLK